MAYPKIVRLADLNDMPHRESTLGFTKEQYAEGRAALIASGLTYNNETGITRNRDGWLERPSNPSDHVVLINDHEVMDWIFSRFINNAASRLSRGYTAT